MKILFVDDNLPGMKVHVLQLRKATKGEVIPVDGVDRALDEFERDPSSWHGIIVDLMMPKGRIVPPEADIETVGYHLLLKIRMFRADIPAIVLTNVGAHKVQRDLEKLRRVKVIHKKEFLADEFARRAIEFFHRPDANDPPDTSAA